MQGEIWKDISGFDGIYQISNYGRVKRLHRFTYILHPVKPYYRELKEMILSPNHDKDGYLTVGLKDKNMKVHRLVANEFLPNPNNLPQINHKDGNKENNCVENLEWCNDKYNNNHALLLGLRHTKKFAKYSRDNGIIVEIYNSLPEAVRKNNGADASTIIKVCNSKRNEHCGYGWIYATDDMKVGDPID